MKFFLISFITLCWLSACSTNAATDQPHETPVIGMPNPASKYCIDIGGSLEIINAKDGSYGMCTLPDGTTIDEWELFRKDHPVK